MVTEQITFFSIKDTHYKGSWRSVTGFKTLCLLQSLRSENNFFIPEHRLSDYLVQKTKKTRVNVNEKMDGKISSCPWMPKNFTDVNYNLHCGKQATFNDHSHY